VLWNKPSKAESIKNMERRFNVSIHALWHPFCRRYRRGGRRGYLYVIFFQFVFCFLLYLFCFY
jgi:hypothetical protein